MKKFIPLLVGFSLLWVITHGAYAAASDAPAVASGAPLSSTNTTQAALQAVTDFLPAESSPAPVPSLALASSQPLWDLLPAYAGIHQAYQDALAALISGEPPHYTAVLTSDYQQMGASGKTVEKTEIEKRLWNVVQRNRCTDTRFGIVSLQMTAPDQATATIQEHLEFFSLNTPSTTVHAGNGKTFTVNNTTHTTITLVLQQEWVQQGEHWRLKRVRTLQINMAAVL